MDEGSQLEKLSRSHLLHKEASAQSQRMKPHIAPSIDFHKKVKITSNAQDQDPGYLLHKLKVNKFNHMKYEHALFANTKKKLSDLFRHAGKPETPYQKHVMENLRDFKKFDNEVITTQNRLKMSKS